MHLTQTIHEVEDEKISVILYPNNSLKSFVSFENEELFFSVNLLDIFTEKSDVENVSFDKIIEGIEPKLHDVVDTFNEGYEKGDPFIALKLHREPDYAKQLKKIIELDEFNNFSSYSLYEFCKYAYSKIDVYPEFQSDLIEILAFIKSNDTYINNLIHQKLKDRLDNNKLTLYRGFNLENRRDGVSFTLNYNVASFFANRFGIGGFVNKYELDIENVLAYIEGEEDEILIYNINNVKLVESNYRE